MGLIYGVYEGRSDAFRPGSVSYETGFCPHGGKYKLRRLRTPSAYCVST